MNLEKLKKEYAKLIIKKGLNIQPGQRFVINAPVEAADFVRLCAHEAYEAGCSQVILNWYDDFLTKEYYLNGGEETFDKVNPWEIDIANAITDEGIPRLAIYAENPENLKDADPERIKRVQVARGAELKKYFAAMTSNGFPWCVVSVPIPSWARLVFPDLTEEEAMEKMWLEILKSARVDEENTIENWQAHSDKLSKHVKILNDYNFKSLHYVNSLGTDFTIDLPKGHYWAGGEEKCKSGIMFSANIPTEEVFTLPDKNSANGKIVASKPLCISGNIVDGFYFIVKDGKIIEAHAEKGEDVLNAAITVDEGASYFGEVALVPFDSPISNSGILFLNTLFDENASCHIAFGEAYPCITGADNMSEDELAALGCNNSITHEDFMIGTRDLAITGTTWDGKEVPVFKDGNFTF